MNSEYTDEPEVLPDVEDPPTELDIVSEELEGISIKLDIISDKLEIIRVTTGFMTNILSYYIVYRSVRWIFR